MLENKYNIPNGIHEISNKKGNVIIKVSRSIKPKIGEYALKQYFFDKGNEIYCMSFLGYYYSIFV